jgi:hypothetical protein
VSIRQTVQSNSWSGGIDTTAISFADWWSLPSWASPGFRNTSSSRDQPCNLIKWAQPCLRTRRAVLRQILCFNGKHGAYSDPFGNVHKRLYRELTVLKTGSAFWKALIIDTVRYDS